MWGLVISRRAFAKWCGAAALVVSAAACRAAPAPGSPPLRVGVFVDTGARGSVLAYSRLATLSPDCEAKFIDGAAVRAGALSGVDVLLMSGGSSVDISASLGDEGRAELERFIREGGGYLGTCAGALLMMETAKYKGLGVIPYTRVEAPPRGGGTIKTIWADCARDLAGIKPGIHTTTYHRGPVMTPCEGHPRLGDFTVMARFGCNILTTKLDPDCPSMGGYASCIAGKYGKGKVWVFSDHPEVNPHTMDLVVGGIRYLTGRTIRFVRDQKKPGQFVVGYPTSFSPGAEGAAFAMELVKDADFHVRGGGFALSSADAVVICDSPDASRLKKLAAPAGVRDLKRFLESGGHVVAWGRGAKCVSGMVKDGDGLHFVKGPAEAMETLRALRKRPLPPVPAPTFGAALPRAEGAVRTGFLLGSGSSGACLFRLLRMIASSPNYDVRFLLGSDVAAGALADIDLFVVPGGWSLAQMKSLGAAGCSNLVNWVRGGGAYYGTCAGAYLVGQSNATRTYIGLTPYRPQVCPYRGNSTDVKCALTDDGRKALGLSAKEFTTLYWGGPVFERAPETALPDSDIRTFATYASQNVYSFSTNTIPAMGGRAAIVGGTIGKGKVLTIATHPEYLAGSRHVVRAGLKYLTGKSAEGNLNPHVRGGLVLGFYCADFSTREIGDLAVKLMGLPGVDLEDVSSGKLQDGTLDHLDAVVLPVPDKEACSFLKAFASRGGKVYACCRTKKQRDAVKAFPAGSVIVCDDENAIVQAIVARGWRVAELNGAPGLWHDGKPVPAMMFWQWEPQEKDTKDMSAAGMDIFAMFGSFPHYRHPYWRKDGSFGMTYQDAHIDNLLSWAPKAAFLPRIFYTAPDWWSVANPGERHVYAPGRKGMQVRESFASLKCREELSPYYRKAVRHLLDRYGDHLMGIHVASGPCGEHFSWDVWGHEPSSAWGDLSEPMRQAFVRYLRRKYGNDVARLREAFKEPKADFESVTLPGKEERGKTDCGWRDPAKGRRVLDYLECCNEVTVDMIDHYCAIVKDESKGMLPTLAFYGYVAEDTWANENDHRGISKMYLSKNLDMLSAPHTYRRRRLGEDGMQRQYLASAALHGKFFIDEGDDMTHLEKRKKRSDRRCTVNTMEESLALLYREFGMTVTHGTGLWYMDLTRGTFRDPKLVDAVGRMRKWAEVALRHDRSHHSEVAVVSQPQSGFYTGQGGPFAGTVTEKLYVKQMGEFYRAGAPFDWYLAEDLDAVVKGKAKVVAFLDCQYLTDEQYALALKLKAQGRTLVFFHAPAYANQTALSWERVKRLTGGETYETLKMKSADELRAIYKAAGVHVYTDSDVVLSANSAWLMLHTREAGDYEIALPRRARKITEITTEKPVAENADRFTWKLSKHSTAVFLLER